MNLVRKTGSIRLVILRVHTVFELEQLAHYRCRNPNLSNVSCFFREIVTSRMAQNG